MKQDKLVKIMCQNLGNIEMHREEIEKHKKSIRNHKQAICNLYIRVGEMRDAIEAGQTTL